jgi:plasmid maintenance system antidote protein VapI
LEAAFLHSGFQLHPVEILMKEFLIPIKISHYRLSKDLNIPQTRVSQIPKADKNAV